MNKRGSDSGRSGEVDDVSDTTEVATMTVTRTWNGEDLLGERERGVEDEVEILLAEGVSKIGCAVFKERKGLIILILILAEWDQWDGIQFWMELDLGT